MQRDSQMPHKKLNIRVRIQICGNVDVAHGKCCWIALNKHNERDRLNLKIEKENVDIKKKKKTTIRKLWVLLCDCGVTVCTVGDQVTRGPLP